MNDRAVALLEQYEIEVLRTRKGRGAILCDTQQGCLIFKEYTGREEQLRLQEQVLKHLAERGTVPAERLLATKEGSRTRSSDCAALKICGHVLILCYAFHNPGWEDIAL